MKPSYHVCFQKFHTLSGKGVGKRLLDGKVPPLIVLALLILTVFIAIIHQDVLFGKTAIDEYSQKYAESQYIKGDAATNLISDSELYVYAAYAYSKGEDPTTINFEHPPLGKYIYALSWLLFANPYTINLLIYPLCLFLVFKLIDSYSGNTLLAGLGMVVFGTLKLIVFQAGYVLFDLPLTIFVVGLFIWLRKMDPQHLWNWAVISLLVGLIASIKYPYPFILILALFILGVSIKYGTLIRGILSLLLAIPVYLTTYWAYFLHQHNLIDFINFEKYRFVWWIGDRSMPKFLILQNLFTGKYHAWWENGTEHITRDWSLAIPVLLLLSLVALFTAKKDFWFNLIALFGLGMLIVYGLGSGTALRYLVILIPFWLTLIASRVTQIITKGRFMHVTRKRV